MPENLTLVISRFSLIRKPSTVLKIDSASHLQSSNRLRKRLCTSPDSTMRAIRESSDLLLSSVASSIITYSFHVLSCSYLSHPHSIIYFCNKKWH